MNASDIIAKIAKDKTLDTIIHKIAKNNTDEDLNDLSQDLLETLLLKDPDYIEELYEKGQMNFFLTRLVINNINSRTSRFYYKYRKNKGKQTSIDELTKNQTDNTIEY